MKKKILSTIILITFCLQAFGITCIFASTIKNVSTVAELQSAHPYTNSMDTTWIYTHPSETDSMDITFSTDTETESNYDYIYILDGDDKQIEKSSGTLLAGKTITVSGNVVKIRLTSDGSVTKNGFTVTNINAVSQTGPIANLNFTSKTKDTITLTFSQPKGATDVIVEYSVDGIVWNTATTETTLDSSSIAAKVTGLSMETRYYFRLNITGGEREGISNIITATTRGNYTSDDSFVFDNGVIKDYIGTDTIVKIPPDINNIDVVTINSSVFENNTEITKVIIPDTVKTIGYNAFKSCTNLTDVVIGEGLKALGSGAFAYCGKLKNLTWNAISANDLVINTNAFSNCGKSSGGINIVFGDSVEYIPAYLFNDNKYSITSTDVIFYEPLIATVTVGNNVKKIGTCAFESSEDIKSLYINDLTQWCNIEFDSTLSNPLYYNADLYLNSSLVTTLNIPFNITEIKGYAFYNCKSITSINLGNYVETIGKYAFYNCKNLSTFVIPKNLINIGPNSISAETITVASDNLNYTVANNIVYNTDKTTLIYYPPNKTATSFTIPSGVEKIASDAFGHSPLKVINCNSQLVEIERMAFYNSQVSTVNNLPTSLRKIGNNAFDSYYISKASYKGTLDLWKKYVTVEANNSDFISSLTYGTSTHADHPICGNTCNCTNTHHAPLTWYSWDGTSSLGSYRYYLTDDVTRETFYNIYGSVSVCLNDHTIETNGQAEGFTISSSGYLSVTDCGTNGEITSTDGSEMSGSSAEVAIYSQGTFRLYNGKLSGETGLINYGTAYIDGGYIYGINEGIYNNNSLYIRGGTISGKYTSLCNSSACTVSDAKFENSISNYGTLDIKNTVAQMQDNWFVNTITNTGTLTAENFEVIIDDNCYGSSIYNSQSGTAELKNVKLPAVYDSTYKTQYYSIHNDSPSVRCYTYGNSEIPAVRTGYANTLSFASKNGAESLMYDKEIKVYIDNTSLSNNSTVISNISKNVADNIKQIDSNGISGQPNGILKFSSGALKYLKHTASGNCGSNLKWQLTADGVLNICGTGDMSTTLPWKSYSSYIKKVIVEDGVTSIASYAFDNLVNLTEAYIGNTVVTIGYEAFDDSVNLQSISIPDSVKSIENYAFEDCYGLKTVYIGKGLETLGTRAFRYNKTTEYIIDEENQNFCTIDGNIYTKDKKTLVRYAIGKTDDSFTVPYGVEKILSSAFESAVNLKNITIPETITKIESEAFWLVDEYLTRHTLSNIYYDGYEGRWNSIQGINDNGNYPLKSAQMHYAKCQVIFKNAGGEVLEELILTNGEKIPEDVLPVIEGYHYKMYSDEQCTNRFDMDSSITRDTVIYVRSVSQTLDVLRFGNEFSEMIGKKDVVQNLIFATDKDVTSLYCFIKYPEYLTLKSVVAKDFSFAVLEDEYTEDGYTTAVILAQYSETELIPKEVILTPFEMIYDISTTATPGSVNLEATEESYLIGNEVYFFEDRIPCNIEITPKLAENIEISGADSISRETAYTAMVNPDYTTNKEVEWSVSDEAIATVDENGIVSPVTSGKIILTATAKDGSGVSAEKEVEIIQSVTSIEIMGSDSIRESTTYTLNILPDYATNKDVEWSISDEGIAIIDSDGKVTPVTSGMVTVTVTAKDGSGVFAEKEINIIKLAECIEIAGEESISSPAQYTATVIPEYTSDKEVLWSVDDEKIATVDEIGIVTPVTSGKIVLTATAKDDSGVYAAKEINIIKLAESIEIIGKEEINEPSQYSVVVLPEYTTNKNAEWSVSDETIATVDENGIVTPLKNGKIVLSAKAEDASGIESTKSIVITVSVRANSITSDIGIWDKEFDSDITGYTISVPAGTSAIYLTTSFENATIKVSGEISANNVRKKVKLDSKKKEIEITLTPLTGNALKANTYKITVIQGTYTKTLISDDRKTFNITPVNTETEKSIILALYEADKLIEIKTATYQGEPIVFTTDKTYTYAKIMVWNYLTSLKPVCEAEYIE